MDRDNGHIKTVDLDRGLFCVHYKSADDEASPPKVVISVSPGDDRKLELLLHPDADQAVLWQPGSTLIVRVSSPARLRVEVVPQRSGGSKAAAVKFEAINQGHPRSQRREEFGLEAGEMRLLGHVATLGDIVVGPNRWIAGPTTPLRIEGIAIEWPEKPADVKLRYAVKSANQVDAARMVDLESFAGTRGRALPIVGIVLEMSGAGAADFQLVAEALFLSAPTLRAIGQRVVLSGPTGREPLVGLRLSVERTDILEDTVTPPQPARKPAVSTGKVRVFRSRPKQEASNK